MTGWRGDEWIGDDGWPRDPWLSVLLTLVCVALIGVVLLTVGR